MKKLLCILIPVLALASCAKATLEVPAVQQFLIFESEGGTVFASITSSAPFRAESDATWCYVEAYDHEMDNLRISISENELADDREAVITLTMEGAPERTITVHQFAGKPYIYTTSKSVVLDKNTVRFEITVSSNTAYTYTLPDWVHDAAENGIATGTVTYYFTADAIAANQEREDKVVFSSESNPFLSASVSVRQTNEILPLLDDPFDWCTGSATAVGGTSGEVRFDNLPYSGGWSSETVNGNYNCWARQGCLRFSRTGYGGILVSPALSTLNGTANVKVSFQAARWCTSSLVHDDNYVFTIVVRGGGTPSQGTFSITCDADIPDWQSKDGSTYSFTITDATSSTQIVWISAPAESGVIPSTDGNGDGTSSAIGRLLLDNVKVEYE